MSAADDPLERALASRGHLEPDPLFRQRLRGRVLNTYVAAREGGGGRVPRRMGQLGRACLYASVGFAASVSSVMALSEQAIPGDLLYPLKRHIEALRLQVLPAHLHDSLAVASLIERIDEMRRLADAGDWATVAAVADELRGFEAPAGAVAATHLQVLDGLMAQLPEATRASVEEVIDAVAPASGGEDPAPPADGGGDDDDDDDGDGDEASDGQATPTPSPTTTASPSPSPYPTASPTASPTPSPSPSPTASPSPTPTPTDEGLGD